MIKGLENICRVKIIQSCGIPKVEIVIHKMLGNSIIFQDRRSTIGVDWMDMITSSPNSDKPMEEFSVTISLPKPFSFGKGSPLKRNLTGKSISFVDQGFQIKLLQGI